MTLKLRRGTDLERQSVIFDEGELIYTTDTKTLWVGDGQTIGGIRVGNNVDESPIALTQNLDLNSFDIIGNGDIDITGAVIANSFVGDGSGLTNLFVSFDPGQEYDISIRGNLRGIDSSLVFEYDTNTINANLSGDGSAISNITLNQLEDVNITSSFDGSLLSYINGAWNAIPINNLIDQNSFSLNVLGDDSTTILDHVSRELNGSVVYTNNQMLLNNATGEIFPTEISGLRVNVNSEIAMIGDGVKNSIEFELVNTSADLSGNTADRGSIYFSRNDQNGKVIEGIIGGGAGGIYMTVDVTGSTYPESNVLLLTAQGKLGLGTFTPDEKLDVNGNVKASGFVQFGSLTTTQRNALTAANGMVIYNTTANRFQGYQNGAWINLDDGTSA